jgi:hypothetical protein
MTILITNRGHHGDLERDLARLESLTADFRRLAAGGPPTAESLRSAPVLDQYRLATRPLLSLIGVCLEHPRLNGPIITTSDLWVFAPDLGWARTLSRFYRLGRPAGTENAS